MMHLLSGLSIAGALSLAVPATVSAQTGDASALQAFTRTTSYAALLNRSLSRLPSVVFDRCPSLISTGSRVVVLKPVTFASGGVPNGGSWLQRFPISGCGNDTTLNLFFSVGAGGKIDTVAGVPGSSVADLTLQNDAMAYARIGMRANHIDCDQLVVKTTAFEGHDMKYPPASGFNQSQTSSAWWETWTLTGCGHTYRIPIDFIPDATGTQVYQPSHIEDQGH